MKNIVITMSETPYPPYSGGKVDFFYKLKILKELGYNIYLIYSYSSERDNIAFEKVVFNYCKGYYSFPRKKNLKSIISFVPYFLLSNLPSEVEKMNIDKLLDGIDIDLILVDHLNSFLLAEYIISKFSCKDIIHRMHNNETSFMYSVFKTFSLTSIKKWLFGLDALKMAYYEDNIYKKYNNIAAISNLETKKLNSKFKDKNIKWIPPFFDFNEEKEIHLDEREEKEYINLKEKVQDKKVLLLTGSFSGGFNVESTKWFIENVFHKLMEIDSNILFIIAGFDSEKHFNSDNNILVIPKYDSVKPLMKITDISIIMATGKAGVKLKLMEALNFRKKVISTVDGVYGSGFEKLIPNTDDKEQFLDYCIKALNDEIDYKNAYMYFEKRFNCKKNAMEMLNV